MILFVIMLVAALVALPGIASSSDSELADSLRGTEYVWGPWRYIVGELPPPMPSAAILDGIPDDAIFEGVGTLTAALGAASAYYVAIGSGDDLVVRFLTMTLQRVKEEADQRREESLIVEDSYLDEIDNCELSEVILGDEASLARLEENLITLVAKRNSLQAFIPTLESGTSERSEAITELTEITAEIGVLQERKTFLERGLTDYKEERARRISDNMWSEEPCAEDISPEDDGIGSLSDCRLRGERLTLEYNITSAVAESESRSAVLAELQARLVESGLTTTEKNELRDQITSLIQQNTTSASEMTEMRLRLVDIMDEIAHRQAEGTYDVSDCGVVGVATTVGGESGSPMSVASDGPNPAVGLLNGDNVADPKPDSSGKDETPGIPKYPKHKAIVKRDSVFLLPDARTVLSNPSAANFFLEYNQAVMRDDPGIHRYEDTIEQTIQSGFLVQDLIRRMSLRMWFAYGWDLPLSADPIKAGGEIISSETLNPMFGYFPTISTNEDVLTDDFSAFLNVVSELAAGHMVARPIPGEPITSLVDGAVRYRESLLSQELTKNMIPLIYISNFGPETYVGDPERLFELGLISAGSSPSERDAAVRRIFDDTQDIKLGNWKRTEVTVKRFNAIDYLVSESEGPLGLRFVNIVDDYLEPLLKIKDPYAYDPADLRNGTGDGDSSEAARSVLVPRRYYDYTFEIPVCDDLVKLTGHYNGSFAPEFEQLTSELDLIYEPVFPNLYVVDFAKTNISEFRKLISLDRRMDSLGLPERFTPDWENYFNRFRYSREHPYISLWNKTVSIAQQTNDMEGLEKLSLEYRNLIFSNFYKETYKETGSKYAPGGVVSVAPMHVTTRFNFEGYREFVSFFAEAMERASILTTDGGGIYYDPISNIASDTFSRSSKNIFVQANINGSLSGYMDKSRIASLLSDYGSMTPFGSSPSSTKMPSSDLSINVMESRQELITKIERVWDFREWFKIYCTPEIEEMVVNPDVFEGLLTRVPEIGPLLFDEIKTWGKNSPTDTMMDFNKTFPISGIPSSDSLGPDIMRVPGEENWSNCLSTVDIQTHLGVILAFINLYLERVGRESDETLDVLGATPETEELADIIGGIFRRYKDIVNGQLAYSEALFYRIEKVDAETDQVTQNFVLPATLLNSGFSHIDAQVRYGVGYRYNIYGYYLVFGNEYWYEEIEQPDPATIPLPPDREFEAIPWVELSPELQERYLSTETPDIEPRYGYSADQLLDEIRDQLASLSIDQNPIGTSPGIIPGARRYTLDMVLLLSEQAELEGLGRYTTAGPIAPFGLSITGAFDDPRSLARLLAIAKNRLYVRYEQLTERYGRDFFSPPGPIVRELEIEYQNVITADRIETIIVQRMEMLISQERADYDAGRAPFYRPFRSGGTIGSDGKEPAPTSYTFAVNNMPHPVIVEASIFSAGYQPPEVKIIGNPPTPPNVDLIPYRSVKDKILVQMNSGQGQYVDKPKIVLPSDVDKFRDMILEQGLEQSTLDGGRVATESDLNENNIEDFDVLFLNDDYPELFEVYRLDFPPSSYGDFSDARKIILDNTARRMNQEEGTWRDQVVTTANSFVDDIVPNKKYWYTFRVVDIHNNPSNPTGVLQVEMVDTGNSIFPTIEEYVFPVVPDSYSKHMRRYIKIKPSQIQEAFNQQFIDEQDLESYLLDKNLGSKAAEARTLWGRKYKLRITSELTGKKIDINFKFRQIHTDKDNEDLNRPTEESFE